MATIETEMWIKINNSVLYNLTWITWCTGTGGIFFMYTYTKCPRIAWPKWCHGIPWMKI